MYIRFVYTEAMADQPRRIIWDRHNLKHLFVDHLERGITREEVEEVLCSPHSFVVPTPGRKTTFTIGKTATGRQLGVAWLDRRAGIYPIHARQVRAAHNGGNILMAAHKKDFEMNTFDDPFDTLSDDEFEAEITHAMEERVKKGLPIEKVGDTVSISLRMDRSVLMRIKAMAKDQNIPYQRLMKAWIEDGLVETEREKVPTLRVVLSDADIQRVTTTGIDILLVRENEAPLSRAMGE